jgi:hypothetical protein
MNNGIFKLAARSLQQDSKAFQEGWYWNIVEMAQLNYYWDLIIFMLSSACTKTVKNLCIGTLVFTGF